MCMPNPLRAIWPCVGVNARGATDAKVLTGKLMVSSSRPCSDRMAAELAPAARRTLGMDPLRRAMGSRVGATCRKGLRLPDAGHDSPSACCTRTAPRRHDVLHGQTVQADAEAV